MGVVNTREICQSCGKIIPDNVAPHVYEGQVVCLICDAQLRRNIPVATPGAQDAKAAGKDLKTIKRILGVGVAAYVLGSSPELGTIAAILGLIALVFFIPYYTIKFVIFLVKWLVRLIRQKRYNDLRGLAQMALGFLILAAMLAVVIFLVASIVSS